jgi:hypothetical protein
MAKTICRPAMNALEKGEAGDATNVTPASDQALPVGGASDMADAIIYLIPAVLCNPVRGVA